MPAFQEDVVYLVLLTTQIACFRPGFVDGGNEGQDWMMHTKPSILCSLEFGAWVVHLFLFALIIFGGEELRQPESQPEIRSLSYNGKRWREWWKIPAQFHTLQGRKFKNKHGRKGCEPVRNLVSKIASLWEKELVTGMYIEIVFLLFLIRTETPSVLDRKIEATFSPQSPNLPFSGLYNNFESVRTGTGSYICTSPNHEYVHPQTTSLQCFLQQWLFVFVLKITLGTSSVPTHHSAPDIPGLGLMSFWTFESEVDCWHALSTNLMTAFSCACDYGHVEVARYHANRISRRQSLQAAQPCFPERKPFIKCCSTWLLKVEGTRLRMYFRLDFKRYICMVIRTTVR